MAFGEIGKVVKNVGQGIFNRTLGRLTGAGISTDSRIVNARAKWSGRNDKTDWRVRLKVPEGPLQKFFDFDNNPLMQPLKEAGGIFWPLTPAVVIQHSANYNAMDQVHSNYPHQAYQNSQVDSFNVIGEFPVQNADDAKHWVATINFLRTATKMFFGASGISTAGSEPDTITISLGQNLTDINSVETGGSSNGDLILRANGTGNVVVDDTLTFSAMASDPTATAQTVIYNKTAAGGGTGLFFRNSNIGSGAVGELISKSKATALAIALG